MGSNKPKTRSGQLMADDDEKDWSLEVPPVKPAPPEPPSPIETPWIARAPGSVGFCDEGIVSPGRKVVILDSLRDAHSAAGEELRLLAAKVQDMRRERGIACLALVSALPEEGKSTLAVGLAGALAREPGRRVLLIEADVRRPSLSSTMGLPHARGLREWLNGDQEYVSVRLVDAGGFFLLVAGGGELERPELLGSQRMDTLLRAARGLFDFVILDATPILPVADAVLIQDLIDGFLLVVRSRQTARDDLRDAMAKLRPDRILGFVLNEHRDHRSSYSPEAYKRYGAYAARPKSGRKRGR
jgi:capsular exopolysaccharide synthesis family protein